MGAQRDIESFAAVAARQGEPASPNNGYAGPGKETRRCNIVGLIVSPSPPLPLSPSGVRAGCPSRGGIILLEVILSLALFVSAAAVAIGACNWSARACAQMRLDAQGADLGVSVLSEMQMGLLPVADSPAKNFQEPMQDWTWQIVTTTIEDESIGPQAKQVEIIVNNAQQNCTYRLVELMCEDSAAVPGAAPSASPTSALPRGQDQGPTPKAVAAEAARVRSDS